MEGMRVGGKRRLHIPAAGPKLGLSGREAGALLGGPIWDPCPWCLPETLFVAHANCQQNAVWFEHRKDAALGSPSFANTQSPV